MFLKMRSRIWKTELQKVTDKYIKEVDKAVDVEVQRSYDSLV